MDSYWHIGYLVLLSDFSGPVFAQTYAYSRGSSDSGSRQFAAIVGGVFVAVVVVVAAVVLACYCHGRYKAKQRANNRRSRRRRGQNTSVTVAVEVIKPPPYSERPEGIAECQRNTEQCDPTADVISYRLVYSPPPMYSEDIGDSQLPGAVQGEPSCSRDLNSSNPVDSMCTRTLDSSTT